MFIGEALNMLLKLLVGCLEYYSRRVFLRVSKPACQVNGVTQFDLLKSDLLRICYPIGLPILFGQGLEPAGVLGICRSKTAHRCSSRTVDEREGKVDEVGELDLVERIRLAFCHLIRFPVFSGERFNATGVLIVRSCKVSGPRRGRLFFEGERSV